LVHIPGNHSVLGIEFYGVQSYHDDAKGMKRSSNIVFTFNVDGIQICHIGDLGHPLTEDQVMDIGALDILMIPVGGHFTIDARQASKIVSQMKPLITIPMHYKTPVIDFPIAPVDDFLAGKDNVVHHDSNILSVDRDSMPESPQIIVLRYEK
jgi:L-ascorbate metabolism protein UlaG (beta-lactamase superfamily)